MHSVLTWATSALLAAAFAFKTVENLQPLCSRLALPCAWCVHTFIAKLPLPGSGSVIPVRALKTFTEWKVRYVNEGPEGHSLNQELRRWRI